MSNNPDTHFTNRLVLEKSPYLIQHAHNPVDWYPYGDEAFARAKAENKPIFISVGYSTCHWCHVMEVESFEDLEIAEFLNEHYVCIKIDREERPDLDNIYMDTVQMFTGHGGWPMSIFTTPDGKPFFAATYFPARDGERGSMRGFLNIIKDIKKQYIHNPKELFDVAAEVIERLVKQANPIIKGDIPSAGALKKTADVLESRFDDNNGGFSQGPKFPTPSNLRFLLRYQHHNKQPNLLKMIEKTLDEMASGGIYDQIGGGFHRYATDERWLVPHFEKMLYDNAQLATVYLDAWIVTKKPRYLHMVHDILNYLDKEMTDARGGFFTATDADSNTSEGFVQEGYFFTWSKSEIEDLLGEADAAFIKSVFSVTERGNYEGRNILHLKYSHVPVDELFAAKSAFTLLRKKLLNKRNEKPKPSTDYKVLCSSNGLAISAFARAGLILQKDSYTRKAAKAARLLVKRDKKTKHLSHSFYEGKGDGQAFLDDYAFLIQGLIDLYETSFDIKWLKHALSLQEEQDEGFWDKKNGGYFTTATWHEQLITREKPWYDGAVPSGNSVSANNLLRFALLTSKQSFRKKAEEIFEASAEQLNTGSNSMVHMSCALDFYHSNPISVVIICNNAKGSAKPFLEHFSSSFVPHYSLSVATEGTNLEEQQDLIPNLIGKFAIDGKTSACICHETYCMLPTNDSNVFANQLNK